MSKSIFVTIAVVGFCYSILFMGLFTLFSRELLGLYKRLALRHRLTEYRRMHTEGSFLGHVNRLLSVTLPKPPDGRFFLFGSGVLFFTMFLLSVRSFSGFTALLIALGTGLLPYLFLRIRLTIIRKKGSFEGERVLYEFIRQYRICNHNVLETLERLVEKLEDCKISRQLFFAVLLRLREAGNPVTIRRGAAVLAYGINTNWSHMLATNICMAAEKGVDISLAVEDILIQFREVRTLVEERKRLNSEATRMTVFMMPLLYLCTCFMSVRYMDLTILDFYKNQFCTREGLLLFLLCLFLFFLNLAIVETVNNQSFDC